MFSLIIEYTSPVAAYNANGQVDHALPLNVVFLFLLQKAGHYKEVTSVRLKKSKKWKGEREEGERLIKSGWRLKSRLLQSAPAVWKCHRLLKTGMQLKTSCAKRLL
jgi:hypothetical protein